MILAAYREFDDRISALTGHAGADGIVATGRRATKAQRIAMLFDDSLSPLSKADILLKLPDISMTTVERTLKALQDDGTITKLGTGRNTRYIKRR
ncbi:hypothetical protein [Bifidobacterium simiiventris]|uniref:hypothetical protein n=1 Tax=Bifidobacterium simiiventris TaxID=2834434 RepID=UPI001C57197B|nr:hypothetical protein [Bifidobacterium simiiventris]MBW3078092.1 hypothetical protein [Bifidobacterium simiiventris]